MIYLGIFTYCLVFFVIAPIAGAKIETITNKKLKDGFYTNL